MPKALSEEFRDDVVRVDRKGGAGIAEIAKDFGITESCLGNWLRRGCVEDGASPGSTAEESAELRERKAHPAARAGERGAAPGGGVSVAGEPAGKMMYPLVRELAVDRIPVAVTCRVLKLARQPYYRWLAARSPTASSTRPISQRVFDAHRDDPEFGYRFLADEVRDAGHGVGSGGVADMPGQRLVVGVRQEARRQGHRRPGPPAHEDLVAGTSPPPAPNRLWLTDIERHEAFANPGGGGRPPRDACRSRRLEAGGRSTASAWGWGWSSPRQRRVVSVLPDGAGSASETERHTQEPAAESSSRRNDRPEPGGYGSGCTAHPLGWAGGELRAG